MTVVRFDASEHNTVLVGDDRYFLFRSEARLFLVHDKCPHRGGPLSLGRVSADGKRLICPWHGTRVSCAALRRRSLPMVRSGTSIVACIPGEAGAVPVSFARRRILANLPADGPGPDPAVAAEAAVTAGMSPPETG